MVGLRERSQQREREVKKDHFSEHNVPVEDVWLTADEEDGGCGLLE